MERCKKHVSIYISVFCLYITIYITICIINYIYNCIYITISIYTTIYYIYGISAFGCQMEKPTCHKKRVIVQGLAPSHPLPSSGPRSKSSNSSWQRGTSQISGKIGAKPTNLWVENWGSMLIVLILICIVWFTSI